ncbi:MAG: DUF3530 family protein [Gammaproteobacteria bacterium]|nr:MAG: DUF3530 family protein [Gammaproteobacteria bacterium]
MRHPFRPLVLLLLLSVTWGIATAADLAREQRIAEQIRDAIFDGEPIELEAAGIRFLGIYQRTEREPARGAALILHGRGANPDWTEVVHPLRIGLPEHGWDTLSIQLPVASEGANEREWRQTLPEAVPRIEAALRFLDQRGMKNVALIAHSFGNRAVATFLASGKVPDAVRAWVAIGAPFGADSPELEVLRQSKMPILDLYGQQDLPQVLAGSKARRLAARDANNDAYESREVPGADHFFNGQDELLLSIVRAWLAKAASGTEVPAR